MRNWIILATTTALAACSGGGVQTAGSTAATSGTATTHSFVNPTVAKTYVGIGATHTYKYSTDDRDCCNQQAQTYAGNATTVRNSGISISYDPRDAIFTLTIKDTLAGTAVDVRFQDPGSRTNFGGTKEPQWGTPNLNNPNIRYLQAGDGNPNSPYSQSGSGAINPGTNALAPTGAADSSYQSTTLFYEVPGSTTKYVTYAGFVRNSLAWANVNIGPTPTLQTKWDLERGAFAYGELTSTSAVPKTGTGSYTGSLLASMVYNPTLDGAFGTVLPTYFQWISGTSKLDVDFAAATVKATLTGTVFAPQLDYHSTPQTAIIPVGSTFNAAGTARIDLVNAAGFLGSIGSASFTSPTGTVSTVNIAGSSLDGAFYGPAAEEIGGGFRIVGGTPDQRIDILGAYTGKK